jgi:hypothetical protein
MSASPISQKLYELNVRNEQTPTNGNGCSSPPTATVSSFDTFSSYSVEDEPQRRLLDEWRAGLERLRGHPPPPGLTETAWHQLKVDAIDLLATHGAHAAALGWRSDEMFGLHRKSPAVRVAASGLARFLRGGSIIEFTAQHARIQHLSGAVLTYRRTEPQSGAVPAWELYKEIMPVEYSMDFDAGHRDSGPWLTWHAASTRDGVHAQGTWSVHDRSGRIAVDLSSRGFVFDWPAARTGWMQPGGAPGVAPQKRWNATRAKFERQPDEEWTRGCAHGPPTGVTSKARADNRDLLVWHRPRRSARSAPLR